MLRKPMESKARTNLLVTGALGHIGSAFIHGMRRERYGDVRLLDNFASQRYVSLFNLPKGIRFSFTEEDIRTAPLEDYLNAGDVVVHLAAITDAPASFDDPEQVSGVNYEGTRRIVDACLARGCRLIFLSTTSVYGTQQSEVDETCAETELRPQSPYATSKLEAERMIAKAGADGLDYVIFRFGTIFGTSIGMRFHTAVNKFVWLAVTGRPLTVWRTALNQRRPYLDLRDAVRALDFVVQRNVFDRRIYNVVTANATVADIVRHIRRHVSTVRIQYVDSPIMNQLSYRVSSRRFRRLGFRFTGSLTQGIADTVALFDGLRVPAGPRAAGSRRGGRRGRPR
jgi:UDP-glucose 4-epimerase